MNYKVKKQIADLVYEFAHIVNNENTGMIEKEIEYLTSMGLDDSIDQILMDLYALYEQKKLDAEAIFSRSDLILALNPDRFKTKEDLLDRLNYLLEINFYNSRCSLEENHALVIDAFIKFNELMNGKFDSFYTGGLMGYIRTGHPLERYHGDLDLLINESELQALKELVDCSEEFNFVSNMDHKEVNGHEYKITYRNYPMSIGLFLFKRNLDRSITMTSYFYEDKKSKTNLYCDERVYSKRYTELCFDENVNYYAGTFYRTMSLEGIYNAKKNGRPKDRYDARVIKEKANLLIDYAIDIEKPNNKTVRKKANDSIIEDIEKQMVDSPKNNKKI